MPWFMRRIREILAGMASILEIQPAPKIRRRRVEVKLRGGAEADAAALRGDWAQVGKDLHQGVRAEKRGTGGPG